MASNNARARDFNADTASRNENLDSTTTSTSTSKSGGTNISGRHPLPNAPVPVPRPTPGLAPPAVLQPDVQVGPSPVIFPPQSTNAPPPARKLSIDSRNSNPLPSRATMPSAIGGNSLSQIQSLEGWLAVLRSVELGLTRENMSADIRVPLIRTIEEMEDYLDFLRVTEAQG